MRGADLALVLGWRNHPDVRRHMFTRHEITPAEHAGWYARASADPARHLLVFEAQGIPSGFVGLARIGAQGVWDWGFYLAPDAPRGMGRRMAGAALPLLFNAMQAHKLCAQVLCDNQRSLRFHEALGFAREGTLRQQHHDGAGWLDVACFGLLREEFLARMPA
jgi:UDP-4-amino-4,6-dideoxy-N-acetyl-beta-L-altrosamine N-acetyltransferase